MECRNVFHEGCFGAALSMNRTKCPFCGAKVTLASVEVVIHLLDRLRRLKNPGKEISALRVGSTKGGSMNDLMSL